MLFTNLPTQVVLLVTFFSPETKRHLTTRIEEHFGKDKQQNLRQNSQYRQVSKFDCFDVIDRDNSHFRLQLKEIMYITWKKPILKSDSRV